MIKLHEMKWNKKLQNYLRKMKQLQIQLQVLLAIIFLQKQSAILYYHEEW